MDDIAMMREALALAQAAADDGEVPVGCVVAMPDGRIVGRGRNRREKGRSALAHAELEAIGEACRTLGGWRLWQCTLYVTLELCPMCAGAIVQSRIDRVVVGSMNPKAGCAGSFLNILQTEGFNHQTELITGILKEECSQLMTGFFKELRMKKKKSQSS